MTTREQSSKVEFSRATLLKTAKQISEPCFTIVEAAYKEELKLLKDELIKKTNEVSSLISKSEDLQGTVDFLNEKIVGFKETIAKSEKAQRLEKLQEELKEAKEAAFYWECRYDNRGKEYREAERKAAAREKEKGAALRKVAHSENRIKNLEKKLHHYLNG
tara:strand:- start:1119 stop:1601 length:483 start_codon:yes stop_codon:yes gene_type:complete